MSKMIPINTNLFLGYPDTISVALGEDVTFHISSQESAVQVSVVRLRCADVDAPGLKYEIVESAISGVHACHDQPVVPGSAVVVNDGSALSLAGSWSIGCYIWPTRITPETQTILSRWSEVDGKGYLLGISKADGLTMKLGTGSGTAFTAKTGKPLKERRWHWVSASFDAGTGVLTLCQWQLAEGCVPERLTTETFAVEAGTELDSRTPFLIGAHHLSPKQGAYAGFFDGKIEAARIVSKPMPASDLRALHPTQRTGCAESSLLAFWDFSVGIDTLAVTDLSTNALHGRLHQLPRRAVTGVCWSGKVHDWRLAPQEYGAIHFHSDDLYDCGWKPTFTLSVPENWKTGFYALRLRVPGTEAAPSETVAAETFIPFFITPAEHSPRAKLAVVASVATYLAYANSALRMQHVHFQGLIEHAVQLSLDEVYLAENPQFANSTYDNHIDGSGRCYSSWLRPIFNMRPRANPFNYVHDTHILDWLEEEGIDYDVITDVEIDRKGLAALKPYQAIITPTHEEYSTLNMMNALMAYQNAGGRHLCLGANSFYWRCAFHPQAPQVLEVRRGMAGTRTWESQSGEVHLAGTGEPGALWRHSGFAPQALVGVGFDATVYDHAGYYMTTPDARDPRVAYILEGISDDTPIGDYAARVGGAVGIETDRADFDLGTPEHSLIIATSHGLGPGALPTLEEIRTMSHGLDGEQNNLVRADMVFFETPNGGAVFSTGSISYALSLSHNDYNNDIRTITRRVTDRFLDPAPFNIPG
ncbi:N,N-dimethylformamidase beta subunit family domain-containing protein [Hoeflea sp. BAL378]|uniref:N,N-dimethylformamidase beta subunit family domain-containing protein n=1 Tax=Hoeflea sp. BAL378 TaxID=1547437 RepID=UPI000A973E79|nr:N,N-dimethylformamidase beta subunit family domain-containing protein [Hoeflea sp. BAL378]